MSEKSRAIHVIGGGISGLIAAKTLENEGYSPIIIEASSNAGGRVQSTCEQGLFFDHGFQVLLTAYPQVQKHLDVAALKLKYFKPGALIFRKGKVERIGDTLRDASALFPTLFTAIGSLSDKLKIFKLSQGLKRKSISQIFKGPQKTTLQYLQEYGFSEKIITNFFKPFFTGIFLEERLSTPAPLFEFIFKMFTEGYAAIPEKGIGAIGNQLVAQLSNTEFLFNKKVLKVKGTKIFLSDKEVIDSKNVLITIPIDSETNTLDPELVKWKSCENLYFTVTKRTFPEGLIGLVPDENALLNNLYFPFGQALNGYPILSVTLVKTHELNEAELVDQVSQELKLHCGISVKNLIKHFKINRALPDLSQVTLPDGATVKKERKEVAMAGDWTSNGSLNAAMASGENAAKAILASV